MFNASLVLRRNFLIVWPFLAKSGYRPLFTQTEFHRYLAYRVAEFSHRFLLHEKECPHRLESLVREIGYHVLVLQTECRHYLEFLLADYVLRRLVVQRLVEADTVHWRSSI